MQPMSDADRKVLTSPGAAIAAGCDVLDAADIVVDTVELLGGTVTHTAYATVHRLCELTVMRELDWENVWLRPWQSVTAGGHTVKRSLGVFRATMPELPMGAEPLTWTVNGADRLSLMQDPMRDTKTSAAGSVVLDEIRSTITDANVPGGVIADSTLRDVVLDRDMVWVLDVNSPDSFLRRVNDLQKSIGGRALFMDSDGVFQVQQYRTSGQRAEEFVFDLTDQSKDIVAIPRTSTTSGWTTFNQWVFVRENLPYEPTDGDGMYIVPAPAGVRVVTKFQSIAAAGQASLVAQGDQVVAIDRGNVQLVEIQMTGFVGMEHFDVFGYRDPQLNDGAHNHCQVRQWHTDLMTGLTHVTLEVPRG